MTPWATGVQCEMKEYVTEEEKEREIRIKALGVKHVGCQFEGDFKGGNRQLKSAPLIVKLPIYHQDYHCVWLALVCCFEDPLPHYCTIIVMHSLSSPCVPESFGWLNNSIKYNKCSVCWKKLDVVIFCVLSLFLSLAVIFYWYSGEYIQQVFCHLLSSWIFTLWDPQRFSLRRGPSLATSCLIREMVDFIVCWRVSRESEQAMRAGKSYRHC